MTQVNSIIGNTNCVYVSDLDLGQASAVKHYSHSFVVYKNHQNNNECSWWIRSNLLKPDITPKVDKIWVLKSSIRRPSDDNEEFLIYTKIQP